MLFELRRKAMRRKILQQLVRRNLEDHHGLLPQRLRRSRAGSRPIGQHIFLAAVIVATSTGASRLSDLQILEPRTQPARGAALADETTGAGPVAATASGATAAAFPRGTAPALVSAAPVDPAILGLEVRRIVIDPGHGGIDPGATALRGISEKDIALDIGRRLAVLLREEGFEVVLTRERDETVSLRERVARANAAHADLFLSIHLNSIPRENQGGVETYFLGPPSDRHGERLAGAENADSGYSLADLRMVLEGVYANAHANESRRLAEVVHREVYHSLRRTMPALEDRGVKTAPFVVLVATGMPAILAEVSSISNQEEAALLDLPGHRQRIAEALAEGMRVYATSQPPGVIPAASRVAFHTKGH